MTSEHKKQIANLRVAFKYYQTLKPKYEREMAEKKKKRLRLFITAFVCCFVVRGVAYLYFTRNQIFLELCRIGTPEEVKAAIARNIWDVNMKDSGYFIRDSGFYGSFNGRTISPYILAARENPNPEVLRVLEQAGAKADKDNALLVAALWGNEDVVKFLTQNGATNKNSALVEFLFQHSTNDRNNALEAAVRQDNAEAVKFLVQNGANNKNYALKEFAKRGDLDMVKFLVQNGANDKDRALELAVNHGHANVVSFLIGNGANVKDWHKFWRETSWSIRNNVIAHYKPQVHKQEIINILKKYGFEIVADNNKFMRGTRFSEKIIAEEESSSGCVYFCTNSICIAEGYFFFSPNSFYPCEYSDFLSEAHIRSWCSTELSGKLLDRAVNALMELCY